MRREFPPLPSLTEQLLDDPAWTYPTTGRGGGQGTARLRVWNTHTAGVRVAVVTELGGGVSITNGIEYIAAAVRRRWPTGRLILIEHWPAEHSHGAGDYIEQVVVDEAGPDWRQIWPTTPEDHDHAQFDAWMAEHREVLLHG